MRKNISKLASLTLVALLTISAIAVFAPSVKAVSPTMEVINPLDGTHDFNFTSDTKSVGDTFVVNITAVNVQNLKNFQFNVTWDGTLLSYVSLVKPVGHVFQGVVDLGYDIISVPIVLGGSSVVWGYTFINDNPFHWTFNGTGTLAQLTLRIIKGVSQGGPTQVNCNIQLVNIPADTFMIESLHGQGAEGADLEQDIAFSAVNGRYFYKWVAPAYNPTLYIKPAVEKPDKINDIFGLEIWVRDVAAGWEIIGFQFALMWNTTFITPAAPFYENGTFLEAFQYYADGVQYVSDVNKPGNNLPPPFHLMSLPTGYNWSQFGAILLPDSDPDNQYHAPFPNVGSGGALLMTVYFQAIYDTVSPFEDWTWIEFIRLADGMGVPGFTYALNKYINIINVGTEDCHYRAPMRVLGLGIDLFTQYDPPYGGQGANMPSDMFGPQQLVDLFAVVTYNEYPVQQKLVGFHIRHNGYDIYREDTTDENGMAHVTFRLPWPCADPVNEIFGKWYVIATVEVAEQVKNDTLAFWVWWKVVILSVEPKHTEYMQNKDPLLNDDLDFTVLYGTYSMQIIPLNLTVTAYDELGFFIGSELLSTTVGWGEYKYYDYMICEPAPFKDYPAWEPVIPLPTNAVVGKGQVFGNAFDNLPWNGGTPYCPEVVNTIDFYIVKPGP